MLGQLAARVERLERLLADVLRQLQREREARLRLEQRLREMRGGGK